MYHRRSSNTTDTATRDDTTTATIGSGVIESIATTNNVLSSSTSIDSDDDVSSSSSSYIVRTSTSSSSLDRNSVVKTKRGRTEPKNINERQKQIKNYRFFLIFLGIILICIWGLVGTWMVIEIHSTSNHHYPSSPSSFLSSYADHNKAGGSVIIHTQQQQHHKQKQQEKQEFQSISNNAPSCKKLSSPDDITVTLVTQVSYDRLWMMDYHCNRYPNHPISIAVYTNNTYDEIIQELKHMDCNIDVVGGGSAGSVDNHRPFVDVAILDARMHGSWNDYPVNELRNLALRAVRTTHILYIDVDFWPSEHLYETIMGNIAGTGETNSNSVSSSWSEARTALFNDPKQALVIPALQLWRQCKEYKDCRNENIKYMARNLKGLSDGIKSKRITIFDPTNRGGHGSTDYKKWFHQSIGSLYDIPCLQSNRYEPFLLVRYCKDLPPFQSVFAGYGKNKVTWMMQVIASGYIFSQVGGVYVLHYPHLDSASRQHWQAKLPKNVIEDEDADVAQNEENNKSPREDHHHHKKKKKKKMVNLEEYKRGQVDKLYFAFKAWLKETIPSELTRLSLCEDAQDDDSKLWIDPELKKQQQQKINQ